MRPPIFAAACAQAARWLECAEPPALAAARGPATARLRCQSAVDCIKSETMPQGAVLFHKERQRGRVKEKMDADAAQSRASSKLAPLILQKLPNVPLIFLSALQC